MDRFGMLLMSNSVLSALKVFLILAQAGGLYRLFTPPASSSADERVRIESWRDYILWAPWPPKVIKAGFCSLSILETLAIVVHHFPSSPVANIIREASIFRCSAHLRLTPLFLLGSLLIAAGAFIRIQSFRELGSLFTFELSFRKNHRLVRTGPYAWVRHPSYTGLFMALVGEILCACTMGSWLAESGVLRNSLAQVLFALWGCTAGSIVYSLTMRMSQEDMLLRNQFGKEYDEWAETVRYRLIPGLY